MPASTPSPPSTAALSKAVVPLTVRLPLSVYEVAHRAADRDTRTLNNWIVKACREQAEREGFSTD